MEEACRDFYAVVRINPKNKKAKKAYLKLKKKVHSRSLKTIVDSFNAAEAKEVRRRTVFGF